MATDPTTIEFLLDQLGPRRSAYTTQRMFGEYCLYHEAKPVAFVCDDILFVKDTPAGRDAIAVTTTPEFGPPYPGAKLYLRLSPDLWDDGEWLARVLDATAAELPAPKPRKAPAKKPPQPPGKTKSPAIAAKTSGGKRKPTG